MYIHRKLESKIIKPTAKKVTILEGPRAVGKTSLMKEQIVPKGYSYTTFADQNTLTDALNDFPAWLEIQNFPLIIDEAQLITVAPLYIKEYVDSLENNRGPSQIILSGSASIAKTQLGGSDPLTRRSRRLRLSPMTQWEIKQHDSSIIDMFFEQDINRTFKSKLSRKELLPFMMRGGFPEYCLNSSEEETQLLEEFRDDKAAIFSDQIIPEEKFDQRIAHEILDKLYNNPSGIYVGTNIGADLGIDRRTADRYLSAFERLYLVRELRNYNLSFGRKKYNNPKIHPIDSSFAYETLVRFDKDPATSTSVFGGLFESFVVNQILDAQDYSQNYTEAYYWRDTKIKATKENPTPEVDLLLIGPKLRNIALEVKSSPSVYLKDAYGIKKMAEKVDLHKGYVVYTGTEVKKLAENIWAIPVEALMTPGAWV
ncbi:MAG: DUF4143 domain-containing protein [Micrococcaceae bacterium]